MVFLNQPQAIYNEKTKELQPIMPKHKLVALKDTKAFKKGEELVCFIQKMSCGRFSIMNGHFMANTHYEVFTYEDLNTSFEELK